MFVRDHETRFRVTLEIVQSGLKVVKKFCKLLIPSSDEENGKAKLNSLEI